MNACSPATLQEGVLGWLMVAYICSDQAALFRLLLDWTSNPCQAIADGSEDPACQLGD